MNISTNIYITCLLQCLVTSKSHCIILKGILRIACLMKTNGRILCKKLSHLYPAKAISSYYPTLISNSIGLSVNMWLHLSVSCKGKWKKRGRAIDFADIFLNLPLIWQAKDDRFLVITKKQKCCYNYKKEEITTPQQT